ncbi:MAG: hypothetical protein JWM59_957 [Verrucomicrobiales bacterium]|nr:hypothetical protein [Verrucomicrobiales bacterium]
MSSGTSSNLETATRDMMAAWARTQDQWRDQKSRQFEESHLAPLPGLLAQSREALSNLEIILRKIKHDCE